MRMLLLMLIAAHAVVRAQGVPTWTAVHELTIERMGLRLAPFEQLIADTQGRIYVRRGTQIRVYAPDGAPLKAFTVGNQKTNGFGLSSKMGLVGDWLWVQDGKTVSIFPRDGSQPSVSTVPTVETPKGADWGSSSFEAGKVKALYPDGSMLLLLADPKGDWQQRPPSHPLARGRPGSKAVTLVAQEPVAWSILRNPTGEDTNLVCVTGALPLFSPNLSAVSVDGGAIVFTGAAIGRDSAGYPRVTVVRSWGDTAYSRFIPVPVRPIPQRVLDSVYTTERLSRACPELSPSNSAPGRAAVLPNVARPRFYPSFRRAVIARDGSVLLGLSAPEAGNTHLLIDPKGQPLASLSLPTSVVVLQIEGDLLWGYEFNEFNDQTVVRYRIKRDR
jgi:hypothetical protein